MQEQLSLDAWADGAAVTSIHGAYCPCCGRLNRGCPTFAITLPAKCAFCGGLFQLTVGKTPLGIGFTSAPASPGQLEHWRNHKP